MSEVRDDHLWKLLATGKADAEAQRDGAEWIEWAMQYVPDEKRKARSAGLNPDPVPPITD